MWKVNPGPEFRKSETKERPFLRYGMFVLGCLTGFLIALLLFPIKNQIIDNIAQISPPVVMLIAFFALIEQKKMRQAGVDPVLISHLSQDTNERSFIRLHISNVGAGAAMNVFAKISDVKNLENKDIMRELVEYDILNDKKPLRVILQNDTVSYLMGRCPDLLIEPALEPFTIKLRYQDIEGRPHTTTHDLDIASFEGITNTHTVQEKIWRELQNIAKKI